MENARRLAFSGCVLALFVAIIAPYIKPPPVVVQMIIYTSAIIHIGSIISLKQSLDLNKSEDQKEAVKVESLTQRDAMLFPIFGSMALISLYLAYRYLPLYWVNLLLTTYSTIIGCIAIAETLLTLTGILLDITFEGEPIIDLKFQLPGILANPDGPYEIRLTKIQLASYIFSFCLGGIFLFNRNWVIHNMFAISFCIQAIALISLGNFKIATILLSGLFVYDIFWVFGTDVMVTVAKSFEGPAKIIFPITMSPWKQSILGLGDVVVPGLFVAMCLRFDLSLYIKKTSNASLVNTIHDYFAIYYYAIVMVSYVLGLLVTCLIMLYFQAAQPALLYLVPACLFSFIGASFHRKQFSDAWSYNEAQDEAQAKTENLKEE